VSKGDNVRECQASQAITVYPIMSSTLASLYSMESLMLDASVKHMNIALCTLGSYYIHSASHALSHISCKYVGSSSALFSSGFLDTVTVGL